MAEPDTGFFRGAGGSVFTLPLPLAENFEYQRVRGQLVRVTEDGKPFEEPAAPKRPADTALKSEWVGYALAVDADLSVDDADAMTKNDLIEKYGK
jgi:hypothetical protein